MLRLPRLAHMMRSLSLSLPALLLLLIHIVMQRILEGETAAARVLVHVLAWLRLLLSRVRMLRMLRIRQGTMRTMWKRTPHCLRRRRSRKSSRHPSWILSCVPREERRPGIHDTLCSRNGATSHHRMVLNLSWDASTSRMVLLVLVLVRTRRTRLTGLLLLMLNRNGHLPR